MASKSDDILSMINEELKKEGIDLKKLGEDCLSGLPLKMVWVASDLDDSLREIGPRIPSNRSSDHGRPFTEIFDRYDHDFYRVDRQLFSPAVVRLVALESGRTFRFGETMPEVLEQSFRS